MTHYDSLKDSEGEVETQEGTRSDDSGDDYTAQYFDFEDGAGDVGEEDRMEDDFS